jgi:hypothetical protein
MNLLNNKYIIAYHIKINKGTKVFYQSKIIWLNILSIINECVYHEIIYIYFFNFAYPRLNNTAIRRHIPEEGT